MKHPSQIASSWQSQGKAPWGRGCLVASYNNGKKKDQQTTDKLNMSIFISRWNRSVDVIARVASVSVLFRSKERGTRVKDCAKNWVALVPFFARPKQIPQEINTGIHIKRLMTSQSVKITFAQSKTRIFHSILHPYF